MIKSLLTDKTSYQSVWPDLIGSLIYYQNIAIILVGLSRFLIITK